MPHRSSRGSRTSTPSARTSLPGLAPARGRKANAARVGSTRRPKPPAKVKLTPTANRRIRELIADGRSVEAAAIAAKAAGRLDLKKEMDCLVYVMKRENHWDLFESFSYGVFVDIKDVVVMSPETRDAVRAYYRKWDSDWDQL